VNITREYHPLKHLRLELLCERGFCI